MQICDLACKNMACGHTKFNYIPKCLQRSLLFHNCVAMNFLHFVQNLAGFVIQVTEWKYSNPMTDMTR